MATAVAMLHPCCSCCRVGSLLWFLAGSNFTSANLTPCTVSLNFCCSLPPAGSDISELTVLTNGPGAPEQPQQPLAPPAQQAQVQAPAVSSAPPAPQVSLGLHSDAFEGG